MQPEVALRLPSTLCVALMILVIASCGFYARWPLEALLVGCLWPALDWVQLFYTTEARAYASVQLLTLLVWVVVIRIVNLPVGEKPISLKRATLWSLLSIAAIACHATSLLPISIAWAVVFFWLALNRDVRSIAKWCFCGIAVASFFGLWIQASGLWQKRGNWASFAGESTFRDLWQLSPQLPIVLACAALFLVVTTIFTRRQSGFARTGSRIELSVWAIAFAGPILAVWLLTKFEFAPLMHRRYAVASLTPLAMVAASLTSRFPSKMTRSLALALLLFGLLVQQNTLAELRKGRLTPWQRLEGWRQTSSFINENGSLSDEVWCASELIEGNAQLPIDGQLDQYLAYPLRGIYAPPEIPQAQVHALVNDPQRWADQILGPRESSVAEPKTIWIAYRGLAADLNRRIAVLSSKPQAANFRIEISSRARSFGTVSVAQIRFEHLGEQ